MKDTVDLSLAEKVSKFNQLEKSFLKELKTYVESDNESVKTEEYKTIIGLLAEAVEIREQIELELAQSVTSNLQLHDLKLRNTISLIRDGHQFITTYAYELFTKKDDDNSFGDDNSLFEFDTLLDHFLSWFDVPTYYRAKLTVGPIVTSKSLPSKLSIYFAEIREAYAYGLEKSCFALCRALLESCLTDKLSQIPAYKIALKKFQEENNGHEFGLSKKINLAHSEHKLLNTELKDLADKIKDSGDEILHAFSNKKLDPQKNDLEVIRDTVRIVEHLYN